VANVCRLHLRVRVYRREKTSGERSCISCFLRPLSRQVEKKKEHRSSFSAFVQKFFFPKSARALHNTRASIFTDRLETQTDRRIENFYTLKILNYHHVGDVFINALNGGDDEDDDEDFVSLGKGKKNVFMAGSKRKTQKTSAPQQQRRQRQKMPPPQQQQSGRQTEMTQKESSGVRLPCDGFICQNGECCHEYNRDQKNTGTTHKLSQDLGSALPFTYTISHTKENGRMCKTSINLGSPDDRQKLFNGMKNFSFDAKKSVVTKLLENIPLYAEKLRNKRAEELKNGAKKYAPFNEDNYKEKMETVQNELSNYANSGGIYTEVREPDYTVKNPSNYTCTKEKRGQKCGHVTKEADQYTFVDANKACGSVRIGHESTSTSRKKNTCKPSINFSQREDVIKFVTVGLEKVPLQEKISTLEALLAKFQNAMKKNVMKNDVWEIIEGNINEHLLKFKKSEHVMF